MIDEVVVAFQSNSDTFGDVHIQAPRSLLCSPTAHHPRREQKIINKMSLVKEWGLVEVVYRSWSRISVMAQKCDISIKLAAVLLGNDVVFQP